MMDEQYWQKYLQQVIDPEAEEHIEKIKQKSCGICGSHDFGWVEVEGWKGTFYYTCFNCLLVC
jgi:formate dehydrogenase maturation protein FdhE